jgi:hypothetical protein
MCNTINNSLKANTDSASLKNVPAISGEAALQLLKEDRINQETLQISNIGVATFQDKNGNSFRAELSKEQIADFQLNAKQNMCLDTQEKSTVENVSITSKMPAGSAKAFTSIYEEDHINTSKPVEIKGTSKDGDWKFNFSMGFNRTKYADTDMHLKSSRVDATIKDFSFDERTSSDFYNPNNWEQPMDAFRWIDEPTNSFTFSAEKNNNVYSITAFHPKFLKHTYQDKHVTGTIDGVAVDKVMPINEEFDGYNDQPGQMHLTRFENTHMQMDWQLGYGRNITIADTHKYGKLVYTPSVYAGLTSGKHYDVYVKPGAYWDFDGSEDKMKIQGGNVAIGNKIKYEYGRVNVFVENKFTFSHLEHQFMDGTAKYNMKYNATTFGLGVNVFNIKAKAKPVEP